MSHFLRGLFLGVLLLVCLHLDAASPLPHKTICLSMIVKDESAVITRCLSSTLPIIDYWVIVDTGSTDGTQQIIKDYMQSKGIPGELHERPWVDFAHNRNQAIQLAKGKADYLFFIDADEFLTYDDDFKLPELDKDYYHGTISYSGTKYDRIKFINNHMDWEYVGVLHEVICPPANASFGTIGKMLNVVTSEGARSKDPEKYLKDAKILEKALQEDPNNARNMYYLAQSYRDAGKHELALEHYEKRIAMGGWDQEVFIAMLGVGPMKEALNKPADEIIQAYSKAFQFRRSRVEPLYYLANFYRRQGNFDLGYQIGKIAVTVPVSNDSLFVQQWMYDYGLALELSICAYWTEKYDECREISMEILKKENLPASIRECVQNNLGFANAKLIEKLCEKKAA